MLVLTPGLHCASVIINHASEWSVFFIGERWLPEQLAKLSNRSCPRVPDCPTAAPSVLTVQRVSRPRRVWTGDTIEPFVH
ncbi:hypothetical protein QQF64_027134 [Cirrhinus molitorella]|uniref:Secreted protein n=1 Tax=Cirrhinus molitorella TaxID=172907 RepID=A0ABR3NBI7_9TELE